MELLSKEIIDQIRAAKAAREATKAETVEAKVETVEAKVETVEDEEYSNFDPIRDIEQFDEQPARGLWLPSW